jgi:hypothetical protein
MAFISSGYNPDKPMENRITDIVYAAGYQEELRQVAVSRDP